MDDTLGEGRARGPAFALAVMVTAISAAGAETELEGAWIAEDATVAGDAAPQIVGDNLSFEGHRFRITKEGELRYGGTFSVDAAAEPPTIRFDQKETETLAGVWLGIYELAGDKLKICDNAPDMTKPRPKDFGDSAAAGYVLVHFTRQG